MRFLTKTFINGLLTVVPLFLTVYVIVWLVKIFESIFGNLILFLIPRSFYVPGMGILLGVVLIFSIGILIQTWGLRSIYRWGEQLIEEFPLIGDIYSSLKELLQYFAHSKQSTPDEVVVVNFGEYRLLGIVTRDNFTDAPPGIADNNMIAVYFPMSYQVGGYTVYLSKNLVTPVHMSKKEALQWTITAGLASKKPKRTRKES